MKTEAIRRSTVKKEFIQKINFRGAKKTEAAFNI